MRPTTGAMLQQNNNNNYPCLNMSGSTQEMLQKCPRAALPFPSRLELGDLPLIRGLRAWALCSKNRRKAGGLLAGRQPPTAPHGGHGTLTSCSRPAGVHLSGEWGRMKYGLPLGLDARQAEVGALVTVATLKTSEGSGKTQTQCLFLQTEKGSCLYSTAKPASGGTSSAGPSVVGGWLRGRTGGGGEGRDTSVRRRDAGTTPPAQTGANRVRVGSGRRWRKSGNAGGREKPSVSREKPQRSREGPAGGERQEVQDKGARDSKKGQQENEGVCRTATCCHSTSPKTCARCRRRTQRRDGQEEQEGGASPSGAQKGARKETQRNEEEEEEEEGDVCELEPPNVARAAPSPDPECDVGEIREAGRLRSADEEQDANADAVETRTGSDGRLAENPREEEAAARVNGSSEASREREEEMEEETGVSQTASTAVSCCCDDVSVAASAGLLPESSAPLGGDVCTAEPAACAVWPEQGSSQEEKLEERRPREDERDGSRVRGFEPRDHNDTVTLSQDGKLQAVFENEARKTLSSLLRHNRLSACETDDCRTTESEQRHESVSEDDELGTRRNPEGEAEEMLRREHESEQHAEDETRVGVTREDDRDRAPTESCASQASARGRGEETDKAGDACSQASGKTSANVANVACADPFTSPASANPAPPLPPLASMATGLPCVVAEEEGDNEGAGATQRHAEGGQEGTRRHRRELEDVGEGERGCTAATDDARTVGEEREDDEFGVFVQAEGESAWSEGFASVPCGSRENVALQGHAVAVETTRWATGWTDGSSPRSDDAWTAFPPDPPAAGQWWPSGAAEQGADAASVFAEAFPASQADPRDLDAVPTLTQLLRATAGQDQDQGLLDGFHDLNKMIGQRNKRASAASRDLLLKTLHLEQPRTEGGAAPWTANRRLSPGLPSANQHAHDAAAKRRLSYDHNRNVME